MIRGKCPNENCGRYVPLVVANVDLSDPNRSRIDYYRLVEHKNQAGEPCAAVGHKPKELVDGEETQDDGWVDFDRDPVVMGADWVHEE